MSVASRFLKNIDLVEKVLLIVLYGYLASQVVQSTMVDFRVVNIWYLADHGIILSFILFRRPTQDISHRARDWGVAFVATGLPMFVTPAGSYALASPAVYGALMLAGITLHFSAKLSLRRSFGVVAANRGVMSAGAYRLIRHPMYAGYMLREVGFLLAAPGVWNAAVICAAMGLYVFRLLAEERVLSTDPSYRELMARTPYRLVPGIF
ncbi:MAG: methyltransferase family protein [Bacteroidota bacterium]